MPRSESAGGACRLSRRQAAAGLGALLVVAGGVRADSAALVAAASDLKFALDEIVRIFRESTGLTVRSTYGSSGNFARQIRQGAPYELFMSADERYVGDLIRDGLLRGPGELYAVGRLAVIAPKGGPVVPDPGLDGLEDGLRSGRIERLAIASPDHAPYGERAREALRHRGLWELARPRLVLGENVAQATQFVTSGSAQAGIVAWSLALAPPVAARVAHARLPEAWHRPLRQRMALAVGAGVVAERFHHFVGQDEARAVLRRFGFVLPGETG